jgi:hypothetical protein
VPSSCVAGSCAKNTTCTPHGVRLALPVSVPPCDTKYWGQDCHLVLEVSAQPVCLLMVFVYEEEEDGGEEGALDGLRLDPR